MYRIVLVGLGVLAVVVGNVVSFVLSANRAMSSDESLTSVSAELEGMFLPFQLAVPLVSSDSSADSHNAPAVRVLWKLPTVYQFGMASSFSVDVCNDGADATLIATGTFGPLNTGTGIYPLSSGNCLTLGYGDFGPVIDARFIDDGKVCIYSSSRLSNAAGSDSRSETRCVPVVGAPFN